MNFDLPPALVSYLQSLDTFIAETITPLQNSDDNIRFFDYRREYSRTDWDNGGLPRPEWEELLGMPSHLPTQFLYRPFKTNRRLF